MDNTEQYLSTNVFINGKEVVLSDLEPYILEVIQEVKK